MPELSPEIIEYVEAKAEQFGASKEQMRFFAEVFFKDPARYDYNFPKMVADARAHAKEMRDKARRKPSEQEMWERAISLVRATGTTQATLARAAMELERLGREQKIAQRQMDTAAMRTAAEAATDLRRVLCDRANCKPEPVVYDKTLLGIFEEPKASRSRLDSILADHEAEAYAREAAASLTNNVTEPSSRSATEAYVEARRDVVDRINELRDANNRLLERALSAEAKLAPKAEAKLAPKPDHEVMGITMIDKLGRHIQTVPLVTLVDAKSPIPVPSDTVYLSAMIKRNTVANPPSVSTDVWLLPEAACRLLGCDWQIHVSRLNICRVDADGKVVETRRIFSGTEHPSARIGMVVFHKNEIVALTGSATGRRCPTCKHAGDAVEPDDHCLGCEPLLGADGYEPAPVPEPPLSSVAAPRPGLKWRQFVGPHIGDFDSPTEGSRILIRHIGVKEVPIEVITGSKSPGSGRRFVLVPIFRTEASTEDKQKMLETISDIEHDTGKFEWMYGRLVKDDADLDDLDD